MKRILCLALVAAILLSGCSMSDIGFNPSKRQRTGDFTYGVWISFNEINGMLEDKEAFKDVFKDTVQNLKDTNIDRIYIHVRSHCDSLFKSEYFPLMSRAEDYDYDIFEFMIEECHKENIKVHAWINPYRVSTASDDMETLNHGSPAYKWRTDENTENDKNVITNGGIYLNPGEAEVRNLVVSGIREIVKNYDVDGIHFDDYFYPSTDAAFDSESYGNYTAETENPLSLEDWRRANTEALVTDSFTAIKTLKEDVIFSVSPAADIMKNYNEFYADIASWVKNGCIDEIIPQLYFGFNYADKNYRFKNILKKWGGIADLNGEVKMRIGLAAYKIGTETQGDKDEWRKDDKIIAKETEICIQNEWIDGVDIFSYTGLFSKEPQNTAQRENLKTLMKENLWKTQ